MNHPAFTHQLSILRQAELTDLAVGRRRRRDAARRASDAARAEHPPDRARRFLQRAVTFGGRPGQWSRVR